MQSGGYDYEFCPEIWDDFLCMICHLALKKPKQIKACGHRFCGSCFNKMKNHRSFGEELLCPLDRNAFKEAELFDDKGAERTIMNWKVKCPKFPKGCDWIGELRNVMDHENVCSHKISLVERVLELESEVKDLKCQLAKESQELKVALEKLKRFNGDSSITDPDDPRSILYSGNNITWFCPFRQVDLTKTKLYRQHLSPPFYVKQYCFLFNLTISRSVNVQLYLHRHRGKFDIKDKNERIVNNLGHLHLQQGLTNKFGHVEKINIEQTEWIIQERSSESMGTGRIFENYLHYVRDSFYQIELFVA